MKTLHIIIYLILTCFTSVAQKKISVIYDRDFDFKSLKTFDFSESSYDLGQKFKKQPYAAKVLIENLSKKGVERIKGEPDALVEVSISFSKAIKINKHPHTIYYSYHAAPGARRRYLGTVHTKSLKARLAINIIDQKSKQTVWTAVWLGEPDPNMKPDKRKRKIRKMIRRMFKNYPVKQTEL